MKKDYSKLLLRVIPQKVAVHRTGVVEFETIWKRGKITKAIINGVLDVSHFIDNVTIQDMNEIVGRDLSRYGGKITLKGIMKLNVLKSLKIEESRTVYWDKN